MTDRDQTAEHPLVRTPLLLDLIFRYLPTTDIKSLALVSRWVGAASPENYYLLFIYCRVWNSTVEQPRFWRNLRLNVRGEHFAEQMESRRLRSVGRLELHGCLSLPQVSQLLEMRGELRVREVRVNTSVESLTLLVKLVQLMVTVETGVLTKTLPRRISRIQYTVIFRAIINCDQLNLKSLQLVEDHPRRPSVLPTSTLSTHLMSDRFLRDVNPNILSKAVVKLEEVNFLESLFSLPTQVLDIFREIRESEQMKLKELNFNFVDLSSVPPNILSKAIVRIQGEVNLDGTNLTSDQVNEIFREIVRNQTMMLRTLHIGVDRISAVPEDILSEGVMKLEKMYCVGCIKPGGLTSEQVKSVFTKILTRKEFKLRVLGITGLESLTRVYPSVTQDMLSRVAAKIALPYYFGD